MIVEVIGPYPPCVRCHRTYKLIRSVARDTGKEVEVKHIYAGSPEAEKYGKIVEAELFAEKMGVGLDYRELFKKGIWMESIENLRLLWRRQRVRGFS